MTGYVISNNTRDEFLVVLRATDEGTVRNLVKWLSESTDAGAQELAEEILNSVNGVGLDEY